MQLGVKLIRDGARPVWWALRQRAKYDDNIYPGFWLRFRDREVRVLARPWRWCMTLKFILCWALKRRGSMYGNHREDWLELASWDHESFGTPDGTMYNWTYAAVASGLRNWRYDVGRDGT